MSSNILLFLELIANLKEGSDRLSGYHPPLHKPALVMLRSISLHSFPVQELAIMELYHCIGRNTLLQYSSK